MELLLSGSVSGLTAMLMLVLDVELSREVLEREERGETAESGVTGEPIHTEGEFCERGDGTDDKAGEGVDMGESEGMRPCGIWLCP